jgi:kinesin family protein 5
LLLIPSSHIINQHLIRIIAALEWKQLIEYGKSKLRSSFAKLQRNYTDQLETVLQSTAANFALLKERIEQVEWDMLR